MERLRGVAVSAHGNKGKRLQATGMDFNEGFLRFLFSATECMSDKMFSAKTADLVTYDQIKCNGSIFLILVKT